MTDFDAAAEDDRLRAPGARDWRLWGTYLSERQWSTVREDTSADGQTWDSFPYADSRRRAYRSGEDGLLGWCDREARLCFSTALWNGRDDHLKERLFGLSNGQGNHGEDVKELYHYVDAVPSGAYARALYRYPQGAFPYADLVAENGRRGFADPEYELVDAGALDGDRYFDLTVEYAKRDADDALIHYVPGEGDSGAFGGNSNWRGPVWFPVNLMIVEALRRAHLIYGDGLRVECPTGSGALMTLEEVARELSRRLVALFLPDASGHRPCHGGDSRYAADPGWRDLLLFNEYFHGDTGRGVGASHQTGWTAAVTTLIRGLHGAGGGA